MSRRAQEARQCLAIDRINLQRSLASQTAKFDARVVPGAQEITKRRISESRRSRSTKTSVSLEVAGGVLAFWCGCCLCWSVLAALGVHNTSASAHLLWPGQTLHAKLICVFSPSGVPAHRLGCPSFSDVAGCASYSMRACVVALFSLCLSRSLSFAHTSSVRGGGG